MPIELEEQGIWILDDRDVEAAVDMPGAVAVMREALRAHGEGRLDAPARIPVPAGAANLVFTVGGLTDGDATAAGYRVYDPTPARKTNPQLVAVYGGESARLQALVIGRRIGPLRTGAIGAVALSTLAPASATSLGLIGTGTHAEAQLEGAAAVRELESVRVFSRGREGRERFAERMSERLGLEVTAVSDPEEAVSGAEIVITATDSTTPVLEADWIASARHLTTVGQKTQAAHELPAAAFDRASVFVTDSLEQLSSYPSPFQLSDDPRPVVTLGEIVAGRRPAREPEDELSVFLSVGLAGTEVALARHVWAAGTAG